MTAADAIPPDTMAELAEQGAAMEEPAQGAIGLHPRYERAKYAARATANAYFVRYFYRLDDDSPTTNPYPAASRHRERFHRSRDGRMVLGSFEHLDDIEFRGMYANSTPEERARLARMVRRGGDEARPPSRSTAWRRHQREQAAA